MNERTAAKRPGADVDAWVWQSQTLADLAAFVQAHGPATKAPLPALNWTLGGHRAISAELPTFEPDAARLATLDAYAAVLGAVVARRTAQDRTVYTVRGRIGRREGTDRQPRIAVIIQATVWRELDDESESLPWRVYGRPRPQDRGRPWLVDAFATRELAEQFTQRHTEHAPLTIVCAAAPAPDGGA